MHAFYSPTITHFLRRSGLIFVAALLSACAHYVPDPEDKDLGEPEGWPRHVRDTLGTRQMATQLLAQPPAPSPIHGSLHHPPLILSPGDRLRIVVPEGGSFSGLFEVNLDGHLLLPYVDPIPVAGLTTRQVQQKVHRALLKADLFKADFLRVSVVNVQWAPIHVAVAGAVFQPGRLQLNQRPVTQKAQQQTQVSGDYPDKRYLSSALKGAGGVRPDAQLCCIKLIREGKTYRFDMRGIFTGAPVHDVPLLDDDHVIVSSVGHYQTELIRPSPITPPGFAVYMSNLATPAPGNAQSSINKGALSIVYGTRFLRAAIAANCVGGTQATNASRQAMLVTTNRITGKTEVLERSIQGLVNHADDDRYNPYVMPNDGIACYDSGVTNARDVAKTLLELLTPVTLIKSLLDDSSN